MPGLSLAAMLRLAAALTFGMFIMGHHLGSAINLHGTLQTQIQHCCSEESPYQFRKGCAVRTVGPRLMSYWSTIREKPHVEGHR